MKNSQNDDFLVVSTSSKMMIGFVLRRLQWMFMKK